MNAREAVYEMWRERGMTTMFGNPGSTELPMLRDFPDDFRYVLALQEAVAVGMADGFAQASGTTGHVNLHTAPGVGNGMGAIFNAQANKTPLLVTAGQQSRSLMTLQANLTNKDATRMPHPLVKWSYEPPRAEDVPHAIARGTYLASLPPRGPVFVSIPFDDWDVDVDDAAVAHQTRRQVAGRQGPDPARLGELVEKLAKAKNPAMVAGPDIDMCGGWDAAVKFAEKLKLPVWATPAPGGGRLGFPENHPLFRGILPPAIGPAGETLKEYDLVLVVGSSVFPYYPNIPGPLLGDDTELIQVTNDPDEAARAPMGDAILADPALTLEVLNFKVEESDRDAPDPPWPAGDPEESDPISSSVAAAVLAEVWPDDGILVLESPSSTLAMRSRLKLSKPGSYLLRRGRRPGLRAVRRRGCAARSAGPSGRLRDRRRLGPVRRHRVLDRCRLQRPPEGARAPQRGVRDPQVVRRAGVGRPVRPGSTCRRSSRRRSRRATASRRTEWTAATLSTRRSPTRSRPTARSSSR